VMRGQVYSCIKPEDRTALNIQILWVDYWYECKPLKPFPIVEKAFEVENKLKSCGDGDVD
jgi:hypothetical protein